ncbi:3-hydroxyacyl-CoA dehydrogenase NAD-binding domain-containing protein [Rhizobium sp. P007]|jgi:3-hydroxybutyryl-CoA dehydrogenase|uniref:3-hydroxyacyl-CoA dehydrogenase family protein n=1 Tax=Rhizobium sp. P007 TaxID=285908 RepID=UPI000DE4A456|nr:3-hydroxyacyl-CoA dehydrogenase NAD-binding domain-containing protein [Rhizobium sp. P007]CAD7045336.1 3-hydroxyacyl-CoA dehydrogenase [Rhizobium sp. P007]
MAESFASLAPNGRICVVGAGFMGCVIATLYSRHGYDVVICDNQPGMLESYAERARPIAASFSDDSADVEAMVNRVRTEPSLKDAVAGAFMVHEAVQEVLETKRAIFEELDRLCPPDVVLATNTSSFLISDIAERVSVRERVLGIHYITPGHIIPVIEIIHSSFTPPELVEWARAFIASIDHVGVACPERPGFLINKIQFAMLTEIYRLVDEGLASRDDIDAAVRLSLGPRLALWGPLLTEDLIVSKKTALAVTDSIYQQTGDENYKGRKALRDLVDRGDLGVMTGKGWYAFEGDRNETIMERDRQLTALLRWLREADAANRLKVR